MIRVKICGITCAEDAAEAACAGADAIGLICQPESPRRINCAEAGRIASSLPAFVTPVLLFVDADRREVENCRKLLPGATLQFHGAESPEFCASFGAPYIKSCGPLGSADIAERMRANPSACALLCDSADGGSGRTCDWDALPEPARRTLPLILAGGLNPQNVADAVVRTRPYGVDVSTGVAVRGNPRRKDPQLMRAFVAAARGVDAA